MDSPLTPPGPGAQTLTLPWPPSLNRLYRRVGARTLISREGRAFKDDAALSARAQGITRLDGPVRLTVRLYRPRRSGDLDNALKALLDSMNGIAWSDDSQIVELHAHRFDDKSNPRVEITLEPAEESEG